MEFDFSNIIASFIIQMLAILRICLKEIQRNDGERKYGKTNPNKRRCFVIKT